MKATWREWGIGDIIRYSWNEFDGKGSVIGRLTTKETDHGIVEADDMKLWVDNDTADMFQRVQPSRSLSLEHEKTEPKAKAL